MADLPFFPGSRGGGGGGLGISSMEINEDGALVVHYDDGTSKVLGEVVGEDGKVYVPTIDEHKILSWNLADEPGEVPDPTDLNPNDEWYDIDDEVSGKTDYIWERL